MKDSIHGYTLPPAATTLGFILRILLSSSGVGITEIEKLNELLNLNFVSIHWFVISAYISHTHFSTSMYYTRATGLSIGQHSLTLCSWETIFHAVVVVFLTYLWKLP